MRIPFGGAMVRHLDPAKSVFLTGDLGFMALEPLRNKLGPRFLNAGVAEQNMVSVAAGLAKSGLEAWVYTIASFCYTRPFEQIRNDVCLHRLPVHMVGNGGGYGYGVMGASHHALEDYGTLLTLAGMHVYVPAFDEDVDPMVKRMQALGQPTYLRLGRCERPAGFAPPPYAPWRRLIEGSGPVIVYVGPLAGSHLASWLTLDPAERPEVWVVSELPLDANSIPGEFLQRIATGGELWVVEEHVAQGGFGQSLASFLLRNRLHVSGFEHFFAKGYLSGKSGSQQFYRRESGIDAASLLQFHAASIVCHSG